MQSRAPCNVICPKWTRKTGTAMCWAWTVLSSSNWYVRSCRKASSGSVHPSHITAKMPWVLSRAASARNMSPMVWDVWKRNSTVHVSVWSCKVPNPCCGKGQVMSRWCRIFSTYWANTSRGGTSKQPPASKRCDKTDNTCNGDTAFPSKHNWALQSSKMRFPGGNPM